MPPDQQAHSAQDSKDYRNSAHRFASAARSYRSRSVIALDSHSIEFILLDEHVLVLCDFVAASLLTGLDRLTRHVIDELLSKPVAGRPIDLTEGHALRR